MKKKLASIWLIGSGSMALSYANTLKALGLSFSVVGRSTHSARKFKSLTGLDVVEGGLDLALTQYEAPHTAIVAVSIEELLKNTRLLLQHNVKNILVEKPAALSAEEVFKLDQETKSMRSNVFVAYNRRFLSSVIELRKHITNDGGVSSCRFEFTEWIHRINLSDVNSAVKKKWIITNSCHVIDTVFNLIGHPIRDSLATFQYGDLEWHPSGSIFCGSGITEENIPFTYHSDWNSAGRWSIDLMTAQGKYVLSPLESLFFIKKGTVNAQEITPDDENDKEYKPGLFSMVKGFLDGHYDNLCTLSEQLLNIEAMNLIAGYSLNNGETEYLQPYLNRV